MGVRRFVKCVHPIVLLSLSQDREKCKPKELLMFRDSIGSSAIVNDLRWGGAFGVDVDFVALGHVAVEYIKISDIEVRCWQESSFLSVISTGKRMERTRKGRPIQAVEYIKISDIEVHFGQASSLELEVGRDAIWSAINA